MAEKQQYIVSARKYRPATFQTVVGQRALTATLKNAIKSDKLAQAYLFCGPRGVGKTSCARIFAKTINCLNPTSDGEACGQCDSCRSIDKGNSFNLVELDAASNNSVEDIRNITDQVYIPAHDGRYRVFIIDEVHMLSNAAFNAFLKTLEEPPKNVVFILATTERHKVIPTILSRCQIYDFRRITVNDIVDHLQYVAQKEGVTVEKEALGVIALKADGAMRDALSIFDQVAASTHGNMTYQGTIDALNVLDQDYYFHLVNLFKVGDVSGALLTFKEILDKGFDPQFFINGLAEHIRNLMVSADPRTVSLLETSEEWEKKYVEQATQLPIEWYYAAMKILNDADFNYKISGNKRLLVELSLIRLSRLLNVSQQATNTALAQPSAPSAPFVAPDGKKPQPAPERKTEAVGESSASYVKPSREKSYKPEESKRVSPDRPKSFRISFEGAGKSNQGINEPRSNPFTQQQLQDAWEEYINTHQEQRILVAAMRSSVPLRQDESHYLVEVDHPAQKQAFEGALNELLDFIKKRLKNDYVSLSIKISEKSKDSQVLNPKEFLKMTIKENPELAQFLKAIDAELM